MSQKFDRLTESKLRYYVYRLIDPRNGQTFYVGKGKGNRVYAHIAQEKSIKLDQLNDKLSVIRDIRRAGLEVGHVIHRHGLDEATAFHVEAALMDAYPGLTNLASGAGSSKLGCMHADQVKTLYSAEEARLNHKALIININQTALDDISTYEATRYAWKLNPKKAAEAEIVVAVVQGMIVDLFVASKWLPATKENFPGRSTIPGRFGFIGKHAPDDILKKYVGKRLPESFLKQGASNPIKYSWKT